MSRYLVTGTTAPIGRALVMHLLQDPSTERVLATGLESSALSDVHDERLTYAGADLTRFRQTHDLMMGPVRELGITCVFHSALHRSAKDEGRKIHSINVESTRELLRCSETHPTINRFIYRSYSDVYRIDSDQPTVIGEEHPLDLSPTAPQLVRNRVEGDVTVCMRMGMARLKIVVLRCAEIFAPDTGSQLWDYLHAPFCFRTLGYDPMLNLLSVDDAVRAMGLAATHKANGIYNIVGLDTLPLSRAARLCEQPNLAVPGPLLTPLYSLRRRLGLGDFRYDMNRGRLHFSGLLDGTRAAAELGYKPQAHVEWRALN